MYHGWKFWWWMGVSAFIVSCFNSATQRINWRAVIKPLRVHAVTDKELDVATLSEDNPFDSIWMLIKHTRGINIQSRLHKKFNSYFLGMDYSGTSCSHCFVMEEFPYCPYMQPASDHGGLVRFAGQSLWDVLCVTRIGFSACILFFPCNHYSSNDPNLS